MMTTEIIEINNFTVMKEQSIAGKNTVEVCDVGQEAVGFVFYESGNVNLDVKYRNTKETIQCESGLASSFFCSEEVRFTHHILGDKPLKSVSVFSSVDYLQKLAEATPEVEKKLNCLLFPQDDFVLGPSFLMSPDMQQAVLKIFRNTYFGAMKQMFVESQAIELMAHYLGMAKIDEPKSSISRQDRERLFFAKEILLGNLEEPPSLKELSKLVGLNDYKLKKGFKGLFGMPVYKYLQQERLKIAHNLLLDKEISVQQAAYSVGYESLSSFSNAFLDKFGYRPSRVGK